MEERNLKQKEDENGIITSEDGRCPYCGKTRLQGVYDYNVILTCGYCENDFRVIAGSNKRVKTIFDKI